MPTENETKKPCSRRFAPAKPIDKTLNPKQPDKPTTRKNSHRLSTTFGTSPVSLLFAQLTHSIGLNDVCDRLRHHGAKLAAIWGAVPPSRNTLSHVNKHRDSDMMEELFWAVLGHLQSLCPRFGPSGRYSGLPRRFKRAVHAVDSTTIALVSEKARGQHHP